MTYQHKAPKEAGISLRALSESSNRMTLAENDNVHQRFASEAYQLEAALLASLIDCPNLLHDVQAIGLEATDFLSHPMRLAYPALESLAAAKLPIAMETLAAEIRRLKPEASEDAITVAAFTFPIGAAGMEFRRVEAVKDLAERIRSRAARYQLLNIIANASGALVRGDSISETSAMLITNVCDVAATDWPEPVALETVLPPVERLELALLPPIAAAFVQDLAVRASAPVDLSASVMMFAIGGLIGRRIGVRMKVNDTWTECPNIWALNVALPGGGKTPMTNPVIGLLDTIEATHFGAWCEDQKQRTPKLLEVEARLKQAQKQLKAAVMNDEGTAEARDCIAGLLAEREKLAVPRPRFVIRDATPEALQDKFHGWPAGMMCVRDELSGLIHELDKQGRESQRSMLIEGWNGNTRYTTDRRHSVNTDVEGMTIAIFGNIQPGPLHKIVTDSRNGVGDDGLLQRFSFGVWPDSEPFVAADLAPNATAKQAVLERMQEIAAFPVGRVGECPAIRFASRRWPLEIMSAARAQNTNESPAMQQWLCKLNKPFAALALIRHVLRYGVKACIDRPICDEDAECAARLVRGYLVSHARRIFSGADSEALDAQWIAGQIASGALGSSFTVRDLQTRNRARFEKAIVANAALQRLAAAYWVRLRRVDTKGRPSEIWDVSPRILAGKRAA